jgi:hypothetical protein
VDSAGDDGRPALEDRVVNLLTYLRTIIQQDARVAIVVSVPLKKMSSSNAARITHAADACFELVAVEDRSQVVKLSGDSKSVSGHMEVMRLPAFGAIKFPLPQVTSYIIRNRRKRLVIEMVEVDPDA